MTVCGRIPTTWRNWAPCNPGGGLNHVKPALRVVVEQIAVADLAEAAHLDADWLPAGEDESDSARDSVHAQRADEGRHTQPRDQNSVDKAGGQARDQCRGESDRHRQRKRLHLAQARNRQRGSDRAQAHDEAGRQVDAAGDDHERLAKRHDQHDRHVGADGLEVEQVEEALARGGEEDDQDKQKKPRPEAADEFDRSVRARLYVFRFGRMQLARVHPWPARRGETDTPDAPASMRR